MRLNNALKLFFVAAMPFVFALATAQGAVAQDGLFALGRGNVGGSPDPVTEQTTLIDVTLSTPLTAAVVGTTQDLPLSSIAFQPGTGTRYVSSGRRGSDGELDGPGARSLYTMDPTTAATTLVGSFGFAPMGFNSPAVADMVFIGNTLYANTIEQLYTINLTTGAATAVGSPYNDNGTLVGGGVDLEARIEGIAYDPISETLYGISWDDTELSTIDTTTGLATSVGVFSALDADGNFSTAGGFAIDSAGEMYVSTGGQQAFLYSIDPSQDLTMAASFEELGDIRDLVPEDTFNKSVSSIAFEPAAAGLSADFDSDEDVDGADFLALQRGFGTTYTGTDFDNWEAEFGTGVPAASGVSAVPEPSSIALLMLGAFGLVSRRKANR